MNCHDFRKKWETATDESILAHIETCDECLYWIEANDRTVEEAIFMKEYPKPSAQLEDRIMQAIYEAAGNDATHSAALHPVISEPLTSKWKSRKFYIPAWVGAAGILLAVGLLGTKLLPGDSNATNMASAPAASQAAVGAESSPPPGLQAFSSIPETRGESQAEGSQPKADTAADQAAKTAGDAALAAKVPEKPVQSATNQLTDLTNQAVASATPSAKQPAPPNHSLAIARSNEQSPMASAASRQSKQQSMLESEQVLQNANVALAAPKVEAPKNSAATPVPENSPIRGQEQQDQVAMGLVPDTEPSPDNSTSSASHPDSTSEAKTAATGDLGIAAVPEGTNAENEKIGLAGKAPITMSSFTDIDSAVQASDIPVPSVESDYTLSSVSVQYESSTSKHASNTQVHYAGKTGEKQFSISVSVNENGKRSLSLPGNFSDTKLFLLGSDQAIGVAYPRDEAKTEPLKTAVHFQTTQKDKSLYVVVSGSGIQLNELVELSKKIVWK